MGYVSLYRKWRPQGFTDVVGQDNIVKTLENSLANSRISHAYLFAGPRGTGKTSVARILAKGLNCQRGPTATPCNECEECSVITEGTSLNVIEIDGASNRGINDVRELRSQVQFVPVNAAYRVYIIDEVHMLTTEAFNALLKTLEEPPEHVVFIFATTDPHRLPLTILSRVQRYDFARLTEKAMVDRLDMVAQGENFSADSKALQLIAQHAGGGMRDALGILEKCASFSDEITIDAVIEVLGIAPEEQVDSFVDHISSGAAPVALQIIDDLYNQGKDLSQFTIRIITKLREDIIADTKQERGLKLQAIELFSDAVREMRYAADPRIALELAILKITSGNTNSPTADLGVLENKVRFLEQQVSQLQAKLARTKETPSKDVLVDQPPRRVTRSAGDKEQGIFLVESWSEFLKELRDGRLMQCEAFLKEGTPVGVESENAVVAFPRDRGFHKASIEQDSHRDSAEKILSKLMGKQMRLKCVFSDEVAEVPKQVPVQETQVVRAKEQEEQEEQKDASADEFLKASMEIFGGKVISKPKEN